MIRLDRTGRGLGLDAIAALAEIHSLGVMVHTREDGDVALERASDTIRPMLRILTGALENEARRDKAVAVYDRKRRDGLVVGNRRAYGLQRRDDDANEPQEPQAQTVRRIFSLAIAGVSLSQIAMTMLREGSAPYAFVQAKETRATADVPWTTTRVRRLIENRSYIGPIVTEAEWTAAQRRPMPTFAPRRPTRHPYLLTGVLQCECGAYMNAFGSYKRVTGDGKPVYGYKCVKRIAHGGRTFSVVAPKIEPQFETLLARFVVAPEIAIVARGATAGDDAANLLEEIAACDRRAGQNLAARDAAWNANAEGVIAPDELARRLRTLGEAATEIAREKSSLEARLRAIAVVTKEPPPFAALLEIWNDGTLEEKRTIVAAVARYLGGIYVAPDRRLGFGRSPSERAQFYLRSSAPV